MAVLKPTIPHFAFPFRIVEKGYGLAAVENEQDTIEDIEDCVALVLYTPRGFRSEAPDFGMTDQVFRTPGVDAALVRKEVVEGEPRAEVDASVEKELDEMIDRVTLRVGGSKVSGNTDV